MDISLVPFKCLFVLDKKNVSLFYTKKSVSLSETKSDCLKNFLLHNFKGWTVLWLGSPKGELRLCSSLFASLFIYSNFFSVQFDEDEKPAAKSDDKDSDDDGEVDEDPKDEKTNANENHSDISENDSEPDSVSSDDEMEDGEKTDETWSPTKNLKRSSKSPSPQKVQPEDHSDISEEEDENFGKDNKGESNNTKNRLYQLLLKAENFKYYNSFLRGIVKFFKTFQQKDRIWFGK